jgi:hypothetical protein
MLTKLRQEEGPTPKESRMLNAVIKKLTAETAEKEKRTIASAKKTEPTVVVLKRKR